MPIERGFIHCGVKLIIQTKLSLCVDLILLPCSHQCLWVINAANAYLLIECPDCHCTYSGPMVGGKGIFQCGSLTVQSLHPTGGQST